MKELLLRPSSDRHRRDVQSRIGTLVDQIGAGELALAVGKQSPVISKYASAAYPHQMPVDILLDAEIRHGYPLVTELLADIQGYALTRKEQPLVIDHVPVSDSDVLGVMEEIGQLVAAYNAAKAGKAGKPFDLRDLQLIGREGHDAIVSISALLRGLGL